MNRQYRFFCLALLLAALVPAVPVSAIEGTPTYAQCVWVTVIGEGDSELEAYDDALNEMYQDYFVIKYFKVSAACPGDPDPESIYPLGVRYICRAEVRACVLPKPRF